MRWALISRREVGFVCAGKGRTVTFVCRIRNTESREPTKAFLPNDNELAFVMERVRGLKLTVIAHGHTHGSPCGLAEPSLADFQYSKGLPPEIIVGVHRDRAEVAAWAMKRTYRETLRNGRIELIPIP